jgi:hypothetical protein
VEVRPGSREEGASHDERLDWLEHAIDLDFHQLESEATYRTEDIGQLRTRLSAVEDACRVDRASCAVSLPNLASRSVGVVGAALVGMGLIFGILDATPGST